MPFTIKVLQVTFTRANGTFGTSGKNTMTLSNMRMSVIHADVVGGEGAGVVDLVIWGLSQSHMNDLYYLQGTPDTVAVGDQLLIQAGEAGGQLSTVWSGYVFSAQPDLSALPEAPFHVSGHVTYGLSGMVVPEISFPNSVPVEQIVAGICANANLRFQNDGVSGINLTDHSPQGTALSQLLEVKEAAGIEMDIGLQTVTIWPKAGARSVPVVQISAGNGLVGAPIRTMIGVDLSIEYNPNVRVGGLINLQSSSLPSVNGKWAIKNLENHLETLLPGGAWFTTLKTVKAGTLGG
jgi:hypothetical protein